MQQLSLAQPATCSGCPLHGVGTGYAPQVGPPESALMFLGEALGREEAWKSLPFVGAAGSLLNRACKLAGIDREGVFIRNVVNCQPPNNVLERAPYEVQAISACSSRYTSPSIEQWKQTPSDAGAKVLVALGGVPLRYALGLKDDIRVQDFHGTRMWSERLQCWVVTTYHPSFIQRGAFNLLHVMKHDLETALEVSRGQYYDEPIDTILDPSVEWFERWVDNYVQAVLQDPEIWLAVDIETPDKAKKQDEGELTSKDRDYHILRVNLSCHPDEGVTVPYHGPYIALIQRALATAGPKIFWNWRYDVPRLLFHKMTISGMILDAMEMWHKLQSDLPRGLGFVAPFYSHYGPWKHLSHREPVLYAALDGPQTLRCAHGIARDLQDQGMYTVPFFRHVYMLDTYVLKPMEDEGLLVDTVELGELKRTLEKERLIATAKLRDLYPPEKRRLEPKQGLVTRPEGEGEILEMQVERMVKWCATCNAIEVSTKHRCKDENDNLLKDAVPEISQKEVVVTRYFRPEPFNPRSTQQILTYITYKHHRPGKNKKTKRPSADKQAIDWLIKNTKDPFYPTLKKMRAAATVESTYVDGTLQRLETHPLSKVDKRLHPVTTHKPSTQRTSMQNPNLQNVIARGEHGSLATLFRRCIVAEAGSYLIEADFSGIEAVLTGYFMGDPNYIRWARRGIHALVAAHLLAKQGKIPASDVPDLSWPEEEIAKMLKHIKKNHEGPYNQCKRCVHGKNYGLTVRGMVLQFPEEFPTLKIAREIEEIYYSVAPGLPVWQTQMRIQAAKDGFLGWGKHPFHYIHWFFNVETYKPVPPGVHKSDYPIVRFADRNWYVMFGEDAKRCVAFYPQSTAAGIIKETMLRLFADPDAPNYIGDAFHGRTPLRAPIHDSLLLEVPSAQVDRVIERVVAEMTHPIEELPLPAEWNLGTHLSIGVEVKLGSNWGGWNDDVQKGVVNLAGMKGLELPTAERVEAAHGLLLPGTLAGDSITPLDEYDEELDEDELEGLQATREVV